MKFYESNQNIDYMKGVLGAYFSLLPVGLRIIRRNLEIKWDIM